MSMTNGLGHSKFAPNSTIEVFLIFSVLDIDGSLGDTLEFESNGFVFGKQLRTFSVLDVDGPQGDTSEFELDEFVFGKLLSMFWRTFTSTGAGLLASWLIFASLNFSSDTLLTDLY